MTPAPLLPPAGGATFAGGRSLAGAAKAQGLQNAAAAGDGVRPLELPQLRQHHFLFNTAVPSPHKTPTVPCPSTYPASTAQDTKNVSHRCPMQRQAWAAVLACAWPLAMANL